MTDALSREAIARIKAAIEPVIHWYQSDEHHDRPLHDIVADIVADLQQDRATVLAIPRPETGQAYVAGPIWAEANNECFTAEIQTVGGHNVVATVHGASREQVEQRQSAILLALRTPAPNSVQGSEGSEAKYADMDVDERATAMANDCVGDPWELLSFFREKLKQAQWETDHARSAAVDLAKRLVEAKRLATPPTDAAIVHPETRALVETFTAALIAKLWAAEAKYGYTDNWRTDDWEAECQRQLQAHVRKGDPLDVAAYAGFCWARGWRTSATPPTDAAIVEAVRAFNQVLGEIDPAKSYAESCGLEGGKLPSAVHIKLDMIAGYAREGIAALAALTPASDASASGEREAYARGIEDAAKAFEDAIGEGYPVPPNKRDKCKHGLYGWESCIPCYDDALTAKIAALRGLPAAPVQARGDG